jgi:hypothetical protein
MNDQQEKSFANLARAYAACGPKRHYPFGEPQAIADFNESERQRIARTPYGRHQVRMMAFNADPSTDNMSLEEFDKLLNKKGHESYQQYLSEQNEQNEFSKRRVSRPPNAEIRGMCPRENDHE